MTTKTIYLYIYNFCRCLILASVVIDHLFSSQATALVSDSVVSVFEHLLGWQQVKWWRYNVII